MRVGVTGPSGTSGLRAGGSKVAVPAYVGPCKRGREQPMVEAACITVELGCLKRFQQESQGFHAKH